MAAAVTPDAVQAAHAAPAPTDPLEMRIQMLESVVSGLAETIHGADGLWAKLKGLFGTKLFPHV